MEQSAQQLGHDWQRVVFLLVRQTVAHVATNIQEYKLGTRLRGAVRDGVLILLRNPKHVRLLQRILV